MPLGNGSEDFWQTLGYVTVEFSKGEWDLILKYLFIAGKHIEERNMCDGKRTTDDPLGTRSQGHTSR